MTLVVNLFAAPGSGKSTMAAGLFHELKSIGVNAELATEFAKDITWANRTKAIQDQFYIFGKQHHRLFVLLDEVDIIITDAPLFLGVVYANVSEIKYPAGFKETINWAFNQYNNLNFLLNRTKEYMPKGRNQTEAESDDLQAIIRTSLRTWGIPFEMVNGNKEGLETVFQRVVCASGRAPACKAEA